MDSARTLECQQVGQATALEHITDNRPAVCDQVRRRFRHDRRPGPRREQFPGQPIERLKKESGKVHGESVYRKDGTGRLLTFRLEASMHPGDTGMSTPGSQPNRL